MTVTIKQEIVNGNYIEIRQEKYSNAYQVQMCPVYKDGTCGYPISDRTYATREQAMRRFRDLKRR